MWLKLWNPNKKIINFKKLFQDLVDQINHDPKLIFEDDYNCSTSLEWILKPSNHYKDNNDILHYLYIRVFSISQMFEWLLIDKFF